ncbi:MAG: hypothetical protein ACETWM_07940 [Candidatus Lokiarchaeia archaeon]
MATTVAMETVAKFLAVTAVFFIWQPEAAAAIAIAGAALVVAGETARVIAQIIYNEYLYSAAYNLARDPTFGICTMDRWHLIYTMNPVEQVSWTNFFVVYCDGGVKQIAPFPAGVYPLTWNDALTIALFFTWLQLLWFRTLGLDGAIYSCIVIVN